MKREKKKQKISLSLFRSKRNSIEKMSSRRPFRVLAPAGKQSSQASDALMVNGERVPDPPGFSVVSCGL